MLGKDPIPSTREIFSNIRREEDTRRLVMMGPHKPQWNSEGSALVPSVHEKALVGE